MLTLVTQDSEYLVENGSSVLVVARPSGEIRRAGADAAEAARRPYATSRPIVGVLGLVELPQSRWLAVATASERVGSIGGAAVFRVTDTELLPVTPALAPLSDDGDYLALVRGHLAAARLLYSPSYDLTSSAQRAAELRAQGRPTLDDRFVWNWAISTPLRAFPEFVFPVIYGVFSAAALTVNGHALEFAVVSRRARTRAGTRYFRRGLDADGNAANFNETEQLLAVGPRLFSFVQTRGSVPALWSEINNLQYKPQLRIGDLDDSVEAAQRHFRDQKQRYGRQFLVNLVNRSGYERPVKEVYEAVVQRLRDPDLTYVYFDFHAECSKMRWHRVQLLTDELRAQGLDETGYFEARDGQVVRRQSGVVRTNCMDCLDRTNVVQSTLALYQLEHQLEAAGVLAQGARVAADPRFVQVFRSIWADNADGVSTAYSGTGALKTDFTRTGRRTKLGALQDLRNSIVRYFRNNLRDGPRQDGYSLFLADYPAPIDRPFADRRPVGVQAMPYLAGGCALITVLSVLYPSEAHTPLFNFVVTLAFAVVAALATKNVLAHGLQYVNWPKLTAVRFVQWDPRGGYQIAGEHRGSKQE